MFKTKIRLKLNWRKILAGVGLVSLLVLSRLGYVPAQAVVQGYAADASVQTGMIVALQPKDAQKVQPATSEDIERMRGVVVDPADAAVTLAGPNQAVFVANTGRFNVLVSNQNGNIKVNDYISISSLPGIGMKARDDQKIVLGRAVANFDGRQGVVSTTEVKDGGNSRSVAIGKLAVDITIIRNPRISAANVPGFVQSVTNSIAGKPVNPTKAYLALAVLVMSGIISGSMLYAGIRSSISAIGRNPLSKRLIVSGLIQVVITSLIIFIGGLFGVYLLLKL